VVASRTTIHLHRRRGQSGVDPRPSSADLVVGAQEDLLLQGHAQAQQPRVAARGAPQQHPRTQPGTAATPQGKPPPSVPRRQDTGAGQHNGTAKT
jgi:hypothetical protein